MAVDDFVDDAETGGLCRAATSCSARGISGLTSSLSLFEPFIADNSQMLREIKPGFTKAERVACLSWEMENFCT
jgi:hypothetical protein